MTLTRVPSFLLKDPRFTDLKDTPTNYAGQAGKVVSVKTDETGLEFTTVSAGGGSGDITGASNVGSGVGIFKTKDAALLQFRTLKSGSNISITTTGDDEVTISASGVGGGTADLGYRVVSEFTSAGIQAAIDDISTTGGTVFLPEGTYNLTSTVVLPVKVNGASLVRLVGAGEATVLKPAVNLTSLVRVEGRFASVEDMRFVNESNRATRAVQFGISGSTSGLQGDEGYHSFVSRCWFESFPVAVYCWDYQSIFVTKNFFVACTTAFRADEDGMGTKITHNYILGGGPCIHFEIASDNNTGDGIAPQQAEGVYILNNDIIATGGHAIVFKGGLHFTIADNMIGEVTRFPNNDAAAGIYLDGSTNGIAFGSIDRNWIGGAWEGSGDSRHPKGAWGVAMTGLVRDIKVNNNTFAGFAVYGISMDGPNILDCKVRDNKFHLIYTADISVNMCQRTLIEGNTFDNEAGTYTIIEHLPLGQTPSNSIVVNNTIPTLKVRNSGYKTLSKSPHSVYLNNIGDDIPFYTNANLTYGGGKVRGAFVWKNGTNQTLAHATPAQITWAAAKWDTDGCFTPSAPSRITVPSWAKLARITANVGFSSATSNGDRILDMTKNGTYFDGKQTDVSYPNGGYMRHGCNVVTGWVPVNAGDYFELQATQSSGGNLDILGGASSWFQVEFA